MNDDSNRFKSDIFEPVEFAWIKLIDVKSSFDCFTATFKACDKVLKLNGAERNQLNYLFVFESNTKRCNSKVEKFLNILQLNRHRKL